MPDAKLTTSADHATHDPLLVAAYAAGDASGAQLDAAAGLVATCAPCAALHHDLRAIALALPATAASAPSPRPRDFRLGPEQAAALRPAGWRRLLAPFAGPGFAFARPLGTGLATLGLAGILVAGASGIPLGGAASAPADDMASGGAPMAASEASPAPDELYEDNAAPSGAPAAGGGGPGVIPGPSPAGVEHERTDGGGGDGGEPGASGEPLTAVGAPLATAAQPETDPASAPVVQLAQPGHDQGPAPVAIVALLSLVALVVGALILGLRVAATRST